MRLKVFLGVATVVVLAGALFAPVRAQNAPAFVWQEAEEFSAKNFQPKIEATALPRLLSGGKWLQFSLTKEERAQKVPAEGLTLSYNLTIPKQGEYAVWARLGYEWVRAPLEWRIGGGAWNRVGTERRTTNLMRLGYWTEVAWLKLGSVSTEAGQAKLEVRYREPNKDGNLIIGLDCFALVQGTFQPEGALKPGAEYPRSVAPTLFNLEGGKAKGERGSITLSGAWQAARYDDPNMDENPYQPVLALPKPNESALHWMSTKVPESAWSLPELAFAHRVLYRTFVQVSPVLQERGFKLHFAATNWIVSVFLNGKLMGSHKGVLVPWDLDISQGVKAGEKNEIVVAVKSPWYAFDTTSGDKLETRRNLPNHPDMLRYARWVAPIYPSSKGEGEGTEYGILAPVTLTVAGGVSTEDVFVKTNVAKKSLEAEITLRNAGTPAKQVTVQSEAVDAKTGAVAKKFPPVIIYVPAENTQKVEVGGTWEDPKLWFPVPNPQLYRLRTTVLEAGKPIDIHEQTFGFRDVAIDGTRIRLNGKIRNFWNWVEVSGDPKTPESFLKTFREEGNRFYRFSHDSILKKWFPYREAMLDFCDANGIPGRLSTCIDGMFINYDLRNPLVWENFNEHVAQVARAYRNRPSVVVYSVENELLYINGQNVFGDIMPQIEKNALAIVEAGRKFDSTRPYMVDGGGALVGNLLPIDCPHYPEASLETYPENAFTYAKTADHSSRWVWDRKRPLMIGESFFYAGKLEDQAWIGGDSVFRGRDYANVGASKYTQLLLEGYRWAGIAGICPWVALDRIPGAQKSFSDLAAFTRKRGHRFYAGRKSEVLVKVFNDTFSDLPVTFAWEIEAGGKRFGGGTETLSLEAGTAQERTLAFVAPETKTRLEGVLRLKVSQEGSPSFSDVKPIAVLPTAQAGARLATLQGQENPLLVWDRSGGLGAYLQGRGVRFTPVAGLNDLAGKRGVLLIGADTLQGEEAFSPTILAFAARGGRVIALEQETPLMGGALPTTVRATTRSGGYAFPQALGTPLFQNLGASDFEDWAGDFPTFKSVYAKPSGGAKSLMECGEGLNYSALVEVPCGAGVIVASQLRIGAKLGVEPAADTLLMNLLATYSDYTPPAGRVAFVGKTDSPLGRVLGKSGVLLEGVSNLVQALNPQKYRIVALEANPENLKALLTAQSAANAFAQAGGWIALCGLTPEGLPAFNQLTGWKHRLRPFRLERVSLGTASHPLLAGLGSRDFTLYGTQEIMFGDYFLSEHLYNFVAGSVDVAPFCKMPDGPEDPLAPYKPTFSDNDPFNYVNGLLNSDSWRYIRQIWIDKEGAKPLTFGFREPETIKQINLWNNVNYWTIQEMDIIFDGDTSRPLRVTLPPNGALTEIKVEPARRVERGITFQIRSWRGDPVVRDGQELRLAGLDNVQFLRELPEEYARKVQVLDSVGGVIAYPRGKGGFLLNQLRFMEDEPNPQNRDKKLRLFSTLLQNVGAGTQSGAVLIPGVNVQYTTLDITRFCNRHIKATPGQEVWFGDSNRTLAHLKMGEQVLAGVPFRISDYVNAPVPQSVMLSGRSIGGLPEAVKGIAVNRKADSLSFLHTVEVRRPVQAWERGEGGFVLPELFRYVVRYADGTATEIPVRLEEQVAHWLQKSPRSLAGAQLAWSTPFPNADAQALRPSLYAMTWNNPKPSVEIVSVEMVLGAQGERAVPALLAITTGKRVGK